MLVRFLQQKAFCMSALAIFFIIGHQAQPIYELFQLEDIITQNSGSNFQTLLAENRTQFCCLLHPATKLKTPACSTLKSYP